MIPDLETLTFPFGKNQDEFLPFKVAAGFAAVDLDRIEGITANDIGGSAVIMEQNSGQYNSVETVPVLLARLSDVRRRRAERLRDERIRDQVAYDLLLLKRKLSEGLVTHLGTGGRSAEVGPALVENSSRDVGPRDFGEAAERIGTPPGDCEELSRGAAGPRDPGRHSHDAQRDREITSEGPVEARLQHSLEKDIQTLRDVPAPSFPRATFSLSVPKKEA